MSLSPIWASTAKRFIFVNMLRGYKRHDEEVRRAFRAHPDLEIKVYRGCIDPNTQLAKNALYEEISLIFRPHD